MNYKFENDENFKKLITDDNRKEIDNEVEKVNNTFKKLSIDNIRATPNDVIETLYRLDEKYYNSGRKNLQSFFSSSIKYANWHIYKTILRKNLQPNKKFLFKKLTDMNISSKLKNMCIRWDKQYLLDIMGTSDETLRDIANLSEVDFNEIQIILKKFNIELLTELEIRKLRCLFGYVNIDILFLFSTEYLTQMGIDEKLIRKLEKNNYINNINLIDNCKLIK